MAGSGATDSMNDSRLKGPTTLLSCRPLNGCQVGEPLWLRDAVTDPHIVDQAGSEGGGGSILRRPSWLSPRTLCLLRPRDAAAPPRSALLHPVWCTYCPGVSISIYLTYGIA